MSKKNDVQALLEMLGMAAESDSKVDVGQRITDELVQEAFRLHHELSESLRKECSSYTDGYKATADKLMRGSDYHTMALYVLFAQNMARRFEWVSNLLLSKINTDYILPMIDEPKHSC
jgi:hypothetical protein